MMTLTYFRLTLLCLVVVLNLSLVYFVYQNNSRKLVSRVFAGLALSTMGWLIFIYCALFFTLNSHGLHLLFARLSLACAVLDTLFFYLLGFILVYDRLPSKKINFVIGILSFCLIILIMLPYAFADSEITRDGLITTTPGPVMPVFALFVSILNFYTFYILINAVKKLSGLMKRQVVLFLCGGFIFYALVLSTLMVPITFYHDATSVQFAPLYVLIFLSFTAVASLKYQLFNVRVIITELFVGLLNFLLLLQLILSNSVVRATVNFLIFLLGCVVSVLLIKNSRKELKQTEERVRVESLQEANRQLQELDRQKTEFLTIAAHQLRTPVSIIKNYIAMLQDGDYGKVSEEVQEIHKNIGESSEWLVRLGDEFLNIAHLEQGQTKYHMSVGDVSLVVDSVINELKGRAAHKGINLAWQRPTESMHTKMDEEKIRNVIFNFVDNAIKYSDAGTVAVNASVEHRRILVRVTDEGIGFTKVDHDKLFKKFQRGDNARKREVNSSSGLGLYIARMFVEGHGGEVWAQSKGLGKGSEFGLWIPVHV